MHILAGAINCISEVCVGMSCEQLTAKSLQESGNRLTPQRLMVISAIRHSSGHLSAGEVLSKIKKSYPYIDISTVYSTLAALKENRLLVIS